MKFCVITLGGLDLNLSYTVKLNKSTLPVSKFFSVDDFCNPIILLDYTRRARWPEELIVSRAPKV